MPRWQSQGRSSRTTSRSGPSLPSMPAMNPSSKLENWKWRRAQVACIVSGQAKCASSSASVIPKAAAKRRKRSRGGRVTW